MRLTTLAATGPRAGPLASGIDRASPSAGPLSRDVARRASAGDVGPSSPSPPPPPPRRAARGVSGASTRLIAFVITAPGKLDQYFTTGTLRRMAWCVISYGFGYYVANTVSLTFGALSINDIIAAVMMVLFSEVVSYVCYTADRWDYRLLFLNWFKLGLQTAFLADAFKLGG